jgi:hypothetical protein
MNINELENEIAKRNLVEEWIIFLNKKYNVDIEKEINYNYLNFLDKMNGKKTLLI